MRARAIVIFPGGFGTLDELFETLTLRQTGRVTRMPIILVGSQYWNRIINFAALAEEGVINRNDLQLYSYADSAEQAFEQIADFYQRNPLNGGD